jgi:ribosomal protein S18 acetylase RimI-like enzyme
VNVEVRAANYGNPADRAGIVDVLDSYASDPIGGGKPLRDDVRKRLVPALRENVNALVLLAFADGQPVGLAVCFFGFSTFNARPLLNIHDLAVLPAYRGKGVGRALLVEAEKHARARSCCRLTLEVQDDNIRARSLYELLGFSDFAVGASAPTRFMAKPLP